MTRLVSPPSKPAPKTRSSMGEKVANTRYSGQVMVISHLVAVWYTTPARSTSCLASSSPRSSGP